MTLTAEKIREASAAGVLWTITKWGETGIFTGDEILRSGKTNFRDVKPHIAPGHITLHGSSERPEWVKPGADILVYLDDSNWYRCPAQGHPYPLDWAYVKYFIVLPEVTP